MTINYLDSKRLQGLSTDTKPTSAQTNSIFIETDTGKLKWESNNWGNSGGWVELGRFSGSATTLDVASLANKRYLMVLAYAPSLSTAATSRIKLNNDGAANRYATRISYNSGADDATSYINYDALEAKNGGETELGWFDVGYFGNYSTKEKLNQAWNVSQNGIGAGLAPTRQERVGKWIETTNPINRITYFFPAGGGITYGTGSEMVVLGWDPADTHTTNFWTELASVDWSSGGTIDSGTFTAKKYLWVQGWWKGNDSVYIRANNDNALNYSWRYSSNGVKPDGTASSISGFTSNFGFDSNIHFINMFIINNSANEKLVISHTNNQNTVGAGYAPVRFEAVSKWANTSSQITSLKFMTGSGNFTGGTIKVYGSN